MKDINIDALVKSLEMERDYLIQNEDPSSIWSVFKTKQMVGFSNIFALTIFQQLRDGHELDKHYTSIFNASRYLLEMLFTNVEIFSQQDPNRRAILVHSIAISEIANAYQDNKKLLEKGVGANGCEEQQRRYQDHLNYFSSELKGLPKEIEEMHTYRFKDFGLIHIQNSKFKYAEIWKNKAEYINGLIAILNTKQVFSSNIDASLLASMYSIYSNDSHPTLSSINDFSKIFGLPIKEKEQIIQRRREHNLVLLKVVGVLMDFLYKHSRGIEISNNSYQLKA